MARIIRSLPGELGILAGLSAFIYWVSYVRPANWLEIYTHTHVDFYSLYRPGSPVHLGLILSFAVLGVIYLLAWKLAQGEQGKAAWAVVLGSALLFGAILLFLYPYDASDIFDYIIHGRMLGVYEGNPYRQVPNQFPLDPFYPYVAWKGDPSPYGPVWELMAGLAARLTGDHIVLTVLAYKMISGAFLLGSLGVVASILKRAVPRLALAGTLLLAWNPVVLYETWGNGHNDMVMVFWVLAAAWAIQRRRHSLAILALVAGALVKFIPVLLFPAALMLAIRDHPNFPQRLSFLVRTGLAALGLAGLLYFPFWSGPEVVTVVNRTNLFTASIPAAIYYLFRFLGEKDASTWVAMVAFGLTAAFALWQAVQAEQDQAWDNFTRASFNILAFYLLVTCLWFQQWYTLWLLGLAPLLRSSRARLLGIVFGFAALSKQLVAGPILYSPPKRLPQPWLEILFTLGVLGIPWLFTLWTLWKSRLQARIQGERLSMR